MNDQVSLTHILLTTRVPGVMEACGAASRNVARDDMEWLLYQHFEAQLLPTTSLSVNVFVFQLQNPRNNDRLLGGEMALIL